MSKIRALNEEPTESDTDDQQKGLSKEAQEAEVHELYLKALRLLESSQEQEAAEIFEQLLDTPYLQEVWGEKITTKSSCAVQIQLRLGCLQSLGTIYSTQPAKYEKGLRSLFEATDMDPENLNTWKKAGALALKLGEYGLSQMAFKIVFIKNPSQWSCMEKLITLSYVLGDYIDCLKYCAHGLGKDPQFVKGMVFTDFVLNLLPNFKESISSYISNSDNLAFDASYDGSWKCKYWAEVEEHFMHLKSSKMKHQWNGNECVLNVDVDGVWSWSDLSRLVKHLFSKISYEDRLGSSSRSRKIFLVCSDGTRRLCKSFLTECELSHDGNQVKGQEQMDDESQSSTCLNRRSSSDEKEALETASDTGLETSEENNERATDDAELGDSIKDSDVSQKKPKRHLKWWQLEGKRRSQRVRGQLVMPCTSTTTIERSFADKLKNIIPESLLILNEEEQIHDTNLKTARSAQPCKQSENYFGTPEESADIDTFINDNQGVNIVDLVIRLVSTLTLKSEMKWPAALSLQYLQLYYVYRSIVRQANTYNIREPEEDDELDSIISLTMLELQFELKEKRHLTHQNTHVREMYQTYKFAHSDRSARFCARYKWLMARQCFGQSKPDNALLYLNIVESILVSNSDLTMIRIPTRSDNIISLETVKNKQQYAHNLKRIWRVNELYHGGMYEDLIDSLTCCLKSDNYDEDDEILHRYYLADAYLKTSRFGECLEQAVRIILRYVKCRQLVQPMYILVECVAMVQQVCLSSENVLNMKTIKQVIVAMVDLLIANDMKHFTSAELMTQPWCIVHTLLKKLEKQEAFLYLFEEHVPSSIVFLKFAHKYLSRFNKCLEDDGRLLLYTLETLVNAEEYAEYEETKHCIEQSVFCLYSYPTKKSKIRHLADHNTNGITLDLDKCQLLFQYYMPKQVPEFDSYETINSEEETLLQRILTIIPTDVQPIEDFENLQKYMSDETKSTTLESIDTSETFPAAFRNIYYLIADHHFKSKEWDKAIEFYTWDLALDTCRFDSWAAIALAKAEVVNSSMNSCDSVAIQDIMSSTNVVVKCFRKALDLEPSNTKLRIEFGSFVYAMHANYNRYLRKYSTDVSNSNMENIQTRRKELLRMATECFEQGALKMTVGNTEDQSSEHGSQQEVWIHHYMLGKVTEKLHPDNPEKFLTQYEMAGHLLHEQDAAYPAKLTFNNSTDLAVEALEIYYRIHASVMSYVEKHEYSSEKEILLQTFLNRAANSPFIKAKLTREGESRKKKAAEKESVQVKEVVEEMLNKVITLSTTNDDKMSSNSPASSETQDSSSTESSSDKPAEETDHTSSPITSFSLSAFCDKIREEEEAKEAAIKLQEEKLTKLKEAEVKVQPEETTEVNPYFADVKYAGIISQCIRAFEECLSRFSAHHKSYFRISYAYFKLGKDCLDVCREWLLGSEGGEKKKIPGLFADRKPTNFFNGIWRSPIDDIDRTGSFCYHMSKTVRHLVEVLDSCNDHEMLAEVAVQLSKVPDPDKQYLYNSDREEYAMLAVTTCSVAASRYFIKSRQDIETVSIAIFGSFAKLQKLNPKDNALGNLLLEVYKAYLEEKELVSEGVTVEQAFRYFQHLAWATKIKQTDTVSNIAGRSGRNPAFASFKTLSTSLKKQGRRAAGKIAVTSSTSLSNISDREFYELPHEGGNDANSSIQIHEHNTSGLNSTSETCQPSTSSAVPAQHQFAGWQVCEGEGDARTAGPPRYSLEQQISAMFSNPIKLDEGGQRTQKPMRRQLGDVPQQRRKRMGTPTLGEVNKARKMDTVHIPVAHGSPVASVSRKSASTLSLPPVSPEYVRPLLFNTSPFRAGSNMVLSPNDYAKTPERDPLAITPPRAHGSSGRTLVHGVERSRDPRAGEVMDFSRTTGQAPPGLQQQDNWSTCSLPLPTFALQGESSSHREQNIDKSVVAPGTSQEKKYPLPPKKKRIAMNLFEADPLTDDREREQDASQQPKDKNVEVIILD